MDQTWIDVYYEALDFFYWEPQHLGRQRITNKGVKTLKAVREHVRLLETTLNHELKQLFCLAPASFRNRVFESALNAHVPEHFELAGADLNETYKLAWVMQPDFLFTSAQQSISIEMKIGAKSCVDQVLKYCLLALAVERKSEGVCRHSLVLLGRGQFADFWKERFDSIADLRDQLEARKDSFLKRKPRRLMADQTRFDEIVSSLEIGFLNYEQLESILVEEQARLDHSEISNVYRKLLSGS